MLMKEEEKQDKQKNINQTYTHTQTSKIPIFLQSVYVQCNSD